MSPSPQAWDREARRFQRIADERRNSEAERDRRRARHRRVLVEYGLVLAIPLALTAVILVLYILGVRG